MVATLFTNRKGGVSSAPYSGNNLGLNVGDAMQTVAENRKRNAHLVGPTQFMNQSHGNVIAFVDEVTSRAPNADGLVTTSTGIALGVLVADCVPLLLWGDGVIAAVHVGRKGLMNGVANRAVDTMLAIGAGDIKGALGPSICGRCYEVGSDVYEEVSERFPLARAKTPQGTLSLDLPGALAEELRKYGIPVTRAGNCTVENPNFYSYRREGVTGRQCGVIWQ